MARLIHNIEKDAGVRFDKRSIPTALLIVATIIELALYVLGR